MNSKQMKVLMAGMTLVAILLLPGAYAKERFIRLKRTSCDVTSRGPG